MKLRDYLEKLDESSLYQIAGQYGFETENAPLHALRNRLARVMEDPHNLEKAYEKLSQEAKKLLLAILSTGNYIKDQDARGLLKGGEHATRTLHEIVSRALLLPFYLGHTQNVYYVLPQELLSLLVVNAARQESIPEVEDHRVYGLGVPGYFQDMMTFLTFLKTQTVKVTQQHELYKRSSEEIAALLLADRLPLIEYTCKLVDLVRYLDGLAVVQEETIEAFIDLDRESHAKLLLQIARMGSIGGYGNEWTRRAIQTFEERLLYAYPRWTDFSSNIPSKDRAQEPSLERGYNFQEYLNLYFVMGLIEEGRLGDRFYYRLTPEGAYALGAETILSSLPPEHDFYLQPNYEILFPYNLELRIRWKLSTFTQLEKGSQMMIAKLSQDSLTRGIDSGLQLDDILGFLHDHAKTGIPQNVEYSMQEWGEKYGQVYLMDAMILRIRNAAMADEIKGNKNIAPYILGEISPVDLIVARSGAKQILKALTKGGYTPLRNIQYPGNTASTEGNAYHQYLQHSPSKLLEDYDEWQHIDPRGVPKNFILLPPADLFASQQSQRPQKGKMLYNPNAHVLYDLMEKAIDERSQVDILFLERGLGRTSEMTIHPQKLTYTDMGWTIQCRQVANHHFYEIPLRNIVGVRG